MASPHVAGVMAIIIGYEGSKINGGPASKVYDRLKANMLTGITTGFPQNPSDVRTQNNFLQTGINAKKNPNDPYAGIPHDEIKLVKDADGGIDPAASVPADLGVQSAYTESLSATVTCKYLQTLETYSGW